MKKNLKCLAFALLAAGAVVLTFYFGGFDFDRRGEAAVFCYLFSILLGAVAFAAARGEI